MARKRESANFVNACIKAIDTIEKLEKEKPKQFIEDLDDATKRLITSWYASYDPKIYRRKGSLYHAYKIEQDGINVGIDFNSEYMSDFLHHQDNEIIYNNAFVGGYHGGSKGQGMTTPFWRRPVPYYSEWYRSAVKGRSLYGAINKLVDRMMEKYERSWSEDLKTKVVKPLQRSYNGLIRR